MKEYFNYTDSVTEEHILKDPMRKNQIRFST